MHCDVSFRQPKTYKQHANKTQIKIERRVYIYFHVTLVFLFTHLAPPPAMYHSLATQAFVIQF